MQCRRHLATVPRVVACVRTRIVECFRRTVGSAVDWNRTPRGSLIRWSLFDPMAIGGLTAGHDVPRRDLGCLNERGRADLRGNRARMIREAHTGASELTNNGIIVSGAIAGARHVSAFSILRVKTIVGFVQMRADDLRPELGAIKCRVVPGPWVGLFHLVRPSKLVQGTATLGIKHPGGSLCLLGSRIREAKPLCDCRHAE